MKRSSLIWLTIAAVLVAILLLVFPFAASFEPSERSIAERPRVQIPEIQPRQFAFVKSPRSDSEDWMFVRNPDGSLHVWRIPIREGTHALPDFHWWRPWTKCKDFGPQFEKGIITCGDSDLPAWMKKSHVWTLEGKSLSNSVEDMQPVVGFEEQGDYVLGEPRG